MFVNHDIQDYYQLLGISRVATPTEIKQAYQRLATGNAPAAHEATPEYLQALQAGYNILREPGRRQEYDAWLQQQPDIRTSAMWVRDEQRALTAHYAQRSRWVLWVLLAYSLLLLVDWVLPTQVFKDERLLSQVPVAVGASLSDAQTMYDLVTPHTRFRLNSEANSQLGDFKRLTVARTLLLHIVRRVSPPSVAPKQVSFTPKSGVIYNTSLIGMPWLLLLLVTCGLWPTLTPELRLSLTIFSVLVAMLMTPVLLIF